MLLGDSGVSGEAVVGSLGGASEGLERSCGAVCGGEWEGVPDTGGGGEGGGGKEAPERFVHGEEGGNMGEKKEGGRSEPSAPFGGLRKCREVGRRKGEKRAGKRGGRTSRQGRWWGPAAQDTAATESGEWWALLAAPMVSCPGGRKFGESRPIAFSRFRHFARRFWNQTCTQKEL
jgi:hypothetical protein